VARRLAGEAMAELCREFGISRKTGYKIFDSPRPGGAAWPRASSSARYSVISGAAAQ